MYTNLLKFALLFAPIVGFFSFLCIGWWAMRLNLAGSYKTLYIVVGIISLILAAATFFALLFAFESIGVPLMIGFVIFVLLSCLAFTIFPIK